MRDAEDNWTFSHSDNTAGILTRRASYSRRQQSVYLVSVVITDGDYPMQSSTGTLTVRVCTCDRDGNMELCNAEALSSSPGLSTGAIIAILLCAIILLSKCVCNVSTSTSCQLNDYSIMVTAVSIFPYHAAASRFPVDHKLLRVFHPGDGPIFHCKHAHLFNCRVS